MNAASGLSVVSDKIEVVLSHLTCKINLLRLQNGSPTSHCIEPVLYQTHNADDTVIVTFENDVVFFNTHKCFV